MAAAGFPSLSNTRYEDLIRDFGENDPNAVITWCQENGLISEIKRCPEQGYNNVMTLANRTGKDGKTWRCQRPCRKTLSVRSGTFFEGSNLLI